MGTIKNEIELTLVMFEHKINSSTDVMVSRQQNLKIHIEHEFKELS